MISFSAEQLREHAHALAKGFNARLIESSQLRPEEALALPHMRVALVGAIIDETTYAVALHEMGHLASALGSLRGLRIVGDLDSIKRVEEAAAWEWAEHYALEWTPVMSAVRAYAEGTYAVPTAAAAPAPAAAPAQKIDWSKY